MFKNKNFNLLFFATFFNSFGDAILFVILLSMLQQIGGGSVSNSLYYLFSALPVLLFGLHIGAYIEKKSLKTVMLTSSTIRIFLLLLCYIYFLYADYSSFFIFLIIFIITFIHLFFANASGAMLPQIVAPIHIPKANSLFRVVTMTGKLIAYSFAALLFHFNLTVPEMLLLLILFYVGAITSIFLMRVSSHNTSQPAQKRRLLDAIKEGLTYIKRDKMLSRLFIIFGLGWMVGSAIDLYLISYLKLVLDKGAENLFIFTTPTMIGILVGSFISPILYNKWDKKLGLCLSLFAFSFAMLCFALQLPLPLLQALLIVGGVSQGILNIFVVSILQTTVPSQFIARVFSVYNIICMGGGIPGYLIFGYLIDQIGVITLGFILSLYLLVIGIICIIRLPNLGNEIEN